MWHSDTFHIWLFYGFLRVNAHFIDVQMFNVIYLAMRKVKMHAGAISKLLYGFASVREDNPRAKSRRLSSRTDAKTYNNLHLLLS